MARPKAKAPARRYHLSGQSVVTLNGRDYYLGKHDSPESIARYAVLIATYQQNGLRLSEDFDLESLEPSVQSLLGQSIANHVNERTRTTLVKHGRELYRQRMKEKYKDGVVQDRHRAERLCDQLEAFCGGGHRRNRCNEEILCGTNLSVRLFAISLRVHGEKTASKLNGLSYQGTVLLAEQAVGLYVFWPLRM